MYLFIQIPLLGLIDNMTILSWIMAWCRADDNHHLSKLWLMLTTHPCATRTQWVFNEMQFIIQSWLYNLNITNYLYRVLLTVLFHIRIQVIQIICKICHARPRYIFEISNMMQSFVRLLLAHHPYLLDHIFNYNLSTLLQQAPGIHIKKNAIFEQDWFEIFSKMRLWLNTRHRAVLYPYFGFPYDLAAVWHMIILIKTYIANMLS